MAINDLVPAVKRVYIEGNYKYPGYHSISFRKTVLGVMANLMGEARQDGRLKLATELESRLRKYRTRLDKEIAQQRAIQRAGNSALFTTTDLERTALKEPGYEE